MAIGIKGEPLIKGKNDSVLTCISDDFISEGRMVFTDGTNENGVPKIFVATSPDDGVFLGISNSDIKASDGKYLIGVNLTGNSIPVHATPAGISVGDQVSVDGAGRAVQESGEIVGKVNAYVQSLNDHEVLARLSYGDEFTESTGYVIVNLNGSGGIPKATT